jgi:hypothetical protein
MTVRWATCAVAILGLGTGCQNLREQIARGPRLPAQQVATQADSARPDGEFAHAQPIFAPVPPPPPPLPTAPVPPPKSAEYAGTIPTLPEGKPDVAPPETPILRTGAIALPDGQLAATETDAGDRKPLRERVKERREERRNETPPAPATPATPAPKPAAVPEPPELDASQSIRKLLDAAGRRYADVPSFEAHLTKREVVNGKPLPQDEITYRFRKAPLSVFMKVLSPEGQGREVMYVQGQFDGKIHLITGKGDNRLVGVGFKTSMNPDDKQATAKSRYRIYEAGFGRTLAGLAKALAPADGSRPAVKSLGLVQRPELPYALEGVEMPIPSGEDPTLPRGGVRRAYFDTKPDSPGYLLPILVVTTDAAGKEVEYYHFSQMKVPGGWTDADWNPATLGKR